MRGTGAMGVYGHALVVAIRSLQPISRWSGRGTCPYVRTVIERVWRVLRADESQ